MAIRVSYKRFLSDFTILGEVACTIATSTATRLISGGTSATPVPPYRPRALLRLLLCLRLLRPRLHSLREYRPPPHSPHPHRCPLRCPLPPRALRRPLQPPRRRRRRARRRRHPRRLANPVIRGVLIRRSMPTPKPTSKTISSASSRAKTANSVRTGVWPRRRYHPVR